MLDGDCGQYLTGLQANKYNREKGSLVNTTMKYSVFFAPNPAIDLTTSNYSARIDEAEKIMSFMQGKTSLIEMTHTHQTTEEKIELIITQKREHREAESWFQLYIHFKEGKILVTKTSGQNTWSRRKPT